VIGLNDSAGRNFPNADGSPVTYASLTSFQQLFARSWFRDHYAKEYYGATSYNDLTAAQQLRIPPYDTAAPAPTTADRERLAIHYHGVNFATLTAAEQNALNAAIAAPNSPWGYINARISLWYAKADDDLIARHDFGRFHDELSAGEQEQVRLLNANIMAYRIGKGSPYGIFSEQQLDRMCDIISQATDGRDRSPTRASKSGKYIFFGGPTTLASAPDGSSLRPRTNIVNALAGVTVYNVPSIPDKSDVILGRPGVYPVPGPNGTNLRINKRCVIRATNAGAFSITGH
jgi:hypothetical protein